MDSKPPFIVTYETLFGEEGKTEATIIDHDELESYANHELPLVDVSRLITRDEWERQRCVREIGEAAKEWGFFQVVNHGIPREVLTKMQQEQVKLFRQPFSSKGDGCNYRWGNPTATSLNQFSWSEAFHFPLDHHNIFMLRDILGNPSSPVEEFTKIVSELARKIAETLAEYLGIESTDFFSMNCIPSSCYLRMNRYPPCPIASRVNGLVPHTDSDFLTILHQDEIGGLQLVKDGKWIGVKPNPDALIVNVGDLFQAWSNDVYKSIEHRVVTNRRYERFSTAYFLCPSYDTVIQNCNPSEPSTYRRFTFREYREQVQEDVKATGSKIGLPRFLA